MSVLCGILKKICGPYKHQICGNHLYILWSELSRYKLSLTLASAHYSYPDSAIGLVGRELGGNFLIIANVYVDQMLCTILIN